MADELKLHVLTHRDVADGSRYAAWDESACTARPLPEKLAALLANPSLHGDDEPMQVVGTREARVIGRIDLVAGDLIADGQRVAILWGSNLFVPPAERRSMMGAMLLMKTQGVHHTVGAHGPSQMALPLYTKLGWNAVPLDRHILLGRSRSVVTRYLGGGAVGTAARIAADAGLLGLRGVNAMRRLAATRSLQLRRVERAPDALDAPLQVMTAGVRGARSAAWLNWLLEHRFGPERRHERALYLVERRGETLGYLLMKVKFYPVATHRAFPNLTLATLADSRSFDANALGSAQLVHLAMRAARDLDADALEVCRQSPDQHRGWLRSLGFLPAGTMNCLWKATGASPLRDPRYAPASAWTIEYGDGENVPG